MPARLAFFLTALIVGGFALSWKATHRTETRQGRTVVTYMTWGDPAQRELEQRMADRFMAANPDIEVRLAHVPGSAYTLKQNIMLASGTAPDVMRVDHYYFPALAKKGFFVPLEPLIEKWIRAHAPRGIGSVQEYLDQFAPAAVEECRFNGQLQGMNMLFGARVIYFNRERFREVGIPDPYELSQRGEWTLEAFHDACRKLTLFDEKGRPVQFGLRLGREGFWPLLWVAGGDILDPTLTKAVIDTPETIKALEFQASLLRDKLTPDRQQEGDPFFAFSSGRIGMMITWAGAAVSLRDEKVRFDWDIAPLPKGPGGQVTTAKGNQLVISRNCPHPEAAWRWIEFLVSEETEREMYVISRRAVPTRKKLLAEEFSVPVSGVPPQHPHVFYDSIVKYGRPMPINDRWFEWEQALSSKLDPLFLGTKNAAEAAKDAQAAVSEILARDND